MNQGLSGACFRGSVNVSSCLSESAFRILCRLATDRKYWALTIFLKEIQSCKMQCKGCFIPKLLLKKCKKKKNPIPLPPLSLAGQTGLKLREILSTGVKWVCHHMWLFYFNSGSRLGVRISVSAVRNGQEKTYVHADVLDPPCVESSS